MSDSSLVKEVSKRLPEETKKGIGVRKSVLITELFRVVFKIMVDKKPVKKSHVRAKAKYLAHQFFNKYCSQSNGYYFWNLKD